MILLFMEKAVLFLQSEMEKRNWRQVDLSRASPVTNWGL